MAAEAEHLVETGAGNRVSVADRWRRWRNRTVSDPRFQRLAARLPFVSRVARRKSEDLFRLATGFVQSQILAATVESGLLYVMKAGKRDEVEIGRLLSLDDDPTRRLLAGAEAICLVERDAAGFWWLTQTGAVAAENPGIEAMIRHHRMLYGDLADPVALLRDPNAPTELARFWAYAGNGGASVSEASAESYSRLMRLSQDLVSEEVLAAYPFGQHESLVDIGGGDGAFLEAIAARYPETDLALFDLPPVAERAAVRSVAEGKALGCHGGNFFTDAVPAADCITLIRVICDHDDAAVLRLLANVRASARPGARIVIGEAMSGPSPGESMAAAYFTFYFLAMRSGRCRTPVEICRLLRDAGFRSPRRLRTGNPMIASVVTAETPYGCDNQLTDIDVRLK